MKPGVLTVFSIMLVAASCSNELGMRDYVAVKTTTATPTPTPVPTPTPTEPPNVLSGTISTFAGNGVLTTFQFPRAVTTDGTYVYVGDTNANTITQINISTSVVSTLADATAGFSGINNLATDGTYVYVVDMNNNRICQVEIATGIVSTLAGSGAASSTNGVGTNATFNLPSGVATDSTNVYVAEQGSGTVRQIDIASRQVSTVATGFGTLTGIATDGTNLYVDDFGSSCIRIINIKSHVVSTFAANVGLSQPDGVTTDGTFLYVADTGNERVVQIALATGTPRTLATGINEGPYEVAVSPTDPSKLFVAVSYGIHAIELIQ
jgi:hypothetical protein